MRKRIETMVSERKGEHNAELTSATHALEHAQADVVLAEKTLEAVNAEVQTAEQEIKESRSIRRIARLIERRLEGKDYERFLGIISAIHEDFKTLSDLLPLMRQESPVDTTDQSLRPVDRVVLYIDDLDRCPSDKVVTVLEAIHLMLAFPLFVVVVGVDIRWIGRSLEERYPEHLDAGSQDKKVEGNSPLALPQSASSLDYLEKIFQIPFWLPPMEEEASRNMIGAMIPPVVSELEPESGEEVGHESEQSAQPGTGVGSGEEFVQSKTSMPESTEVGGAESLQIEPDEREFMLSLAGAVGKSPRRLKRFVNTYRILKASCDALEREGFVVEGGKRGNYRAAMTLLALTIGAPKTAIDILGKLNSLTDEDKLDKVDSYLQQLGGNQNTEEIGYAQKALQMYRGELRELRYWAPRVARFSFRSARL